MPLPKPKEGESKDKFMERCMGNETTNKDFPDNKQRYAVCNKLWDDKDKQKRSNIHFTSLDVGINNNNSIMDNIKELMASRDAKSQDIDKIVSDAKEAERELSDEELASIDKLKGEIREASKTLDEAIESERKLKDEEIEAIRSQKEAIEASISERDGEIEKLKGELETSKRDSEAKVTELSTKVEELETEKRNLENVNVVQTRKMEKFNLSKALIAAYRGNRQEGAEKKIADMISPSMRSGSVDTIQIPLHSRAQGDGHDTTVQSDNIDQVAIPDLSIIGKKPMWREMGVKYLPNLQGTVTLPYKSPKVAEDLAEIAATTLDTVTSTGVLLQPGRVSVQQRWSKELLASENPALHNQMIMDMVEAVDRKLSAKVFQKALAGATSVATANDISKASFDLLMAQPEIETDGAFASNRTDFFAAKTKAIDSGSGLFLASLIGNGQGRTYDGIPYFYSSLFQDATNPTTESYVVYGDFNKVVLGDWGMLEIIVNPYSYSGTGEVEITVCKIANVALHDPNAFAKSADLDAST